MIAGPITSEGFLSRKGNVRAEIDTLWGRWALRPYAWERLACDGDDPVHVFAGEVNVIAAIPDDCMSDKVVRPTLTSQPYWHC